MYIYVVGVKLTVYHLSHNFDSSITVSKANGSIVWIVHVCESTRAVVRQVVVTILFNYNYLFLLKKFFPHLHQQ